MITGSFNASLKTYFDAISGEFTSMTEAEIGKRTFNVKKGIKKLLKDNLTDSVLRAYNSTTNVAKFKVSEHMSEISAPIIELVCKYSKPNSDEMSIYFNKGRGVPSKYFFEGYIWFIYFKANDTMPWFGIMDDAQFISIKDDDLTTLDYDVDEAESECSEDILAFYFDLDSINIEEVAPPPRKTNLCNKVAYPPTHTISHDKLKHQERNKTIRGEKGEEIVMKIERDRMLAHNRHDLVNKIVWVAKQTDGLGYDIESFDFDENNNEYKIFIEVKATSGGKSTPFNISKNEVMVSHDKKNLYYIYRIYNLNSNGEKVKYYRVCGSIEDNFILEPVIYKATKK